MLRNIINKNPNIREDKINNIKEIIFKNKKNIIPFELSNEPVNYLNSFIGDGIGYIPDGFSPPENMKLILQINLEESQNLENFPEKGILQVWCSGSEMFEKENNDGKVIYHKDSRLNSNHQKYELFNCEDPFYLDEPCKINFKNKTTRSITPYTNEFNTLNIENLIEELTEEEEEFLYDIIDNNIILNHYLGGYPYFTQEDPREDNDNEISLIQLGYCDFLCIGDSGTFQVFITEEDLINLNFNKAWCNWDCC
jgi:uncharacterized protein YwqG